MGDFAVNIHACFPRFPSQTNHVRFGAADRGAADAIAAIISGVIAGRITSKVETMQRTAPEAEHPEGTRRALKAYALTAAGVPLRFRVRNLKDSAGRPVEDFAAIILGVAGPGDGSGIGAISGPMYHPGTGAVFVACNAAVHTLVP